MIHDGTCVFTDVLMDGWTVPTYGRYVCVYARSWDRQVSRSVPSQLGALLGGSRVIWAIHIV